MSHYVIHKPISPSIAQKLIKRAPQGKLNNRTIHDDGEGNLAGYVAEQYMLHLYEVMFPDADIQYVANESVNYDIIIDGHKVDVKAKMRTAHGIRPDWDVSIAEYTIPKQQCDSYAFCNVTFDKTKTIPLHFYYIGTRSKKAFLQHARVLKKGQLDGGNILPNGQPFRVREDCRNLYFKDLKQYDYDIIEPVLNAGYQLIEWT